MVFFFEKFFFLFPEEFRQRLQEFCSSEQQDRFDRVPQFFHFEVFRLVRKHSSEQQPFRLHLFQKFFRNHGQEFRLLRQKFCCRRQGSSGY